MARDFTKLFGGDQNNRLLAVERRIANRVAKLGLEPLH
jgi:hypothetical protein